MKITALEEYGIRCLLQVAKASQEGVSISEISKREGLSIQYISKLTSILRKAGLLSSRRGIRGGDHLAKHPTKIKLSTVLSVLGGVKFDHVLCEAHTGHKRACVHESNCSVRSVWGGIYGYVFSILDKMTLADLLKSEEGTRDQLLQLISDQKQEDEREGKFRMIQGKKT